VIEKMILCRFIFYDPNAAASPEHEAALFWHEA
jgi:hypothetical protein